MGSLAVISNILGLAIGAGLNLYAAVLVTGLGIRFGWLSSLPQELNILANPLVLGTAGLLYAAEFVADKVPFFTPIWDAVHTFIRPLGGALLALGAAADMSPTVKLLAALGAGTLALGTHSSKMGFRLAAHAVPDPTSHSVISVAEDISVVAMLLLAYQYPWIAIPLAACLIVVMLIMLPVLLRVLRFLTAGLLGRLLSFVAGGSYEAVPGWVPKGHLTARVFVRNAPKVPRLVEGYVVSTGTGANLYYKRMFGQIRTHPIGELEPEVNWGLFYNVARTTNGSTFYVTKEWGEKVRTMAPSPRPAS